MKYLCTNNILLNNQHDVRKSGPCETQLLMLFNDIARLCSNGGHLDAAL